MDLLTSIPNCKLKEVFVRKVQDEAEKYSNLHTELQTICVQISYELRQINELFPEYTPHDKDYHISHLFRIADILLGECRYEKFNTVELYLLIVAMYAHDWGMAVSKSERYFIATGKKLDGYNDVINLLDDERVKFKEFTMLKLGEFDLHNDDDMELAYWQEYLRDTHALRSAKRIQSYYQNINSSIAAALSKICVGHWLEAEDISDRNGYYVDSSVCGETVNLRALTVYIRLIDLFDLAEDRTPYVIWKYVNPQNIYSKMEWNKHRALHQITCPTYESGRVICICGSTDDHDVYASLMDLKTICEKYFRECSDLLAHMNDSKYELGVYFLDWRIEARNFKPIKVNFEFERGNVFEILSQEIYNCHPYVYIRELIQNSVDAITLRREILDRKKIGGTNIGYISIEVNDITADDIEIVCKDDGIGMDEYILREYFAVLGKSYYQSIDFKNQRLSMSPISKFGIGILSCFAVASQMTINTAREPYMGEGRERLKVTINDIKKQFRIEEVPGYNHEIGTKIILRIRKSTLEKHLKKNNMQLDDFNITDYVKKVLGFVAYPILINERNEKTIIVHPEYDIHRLINIIDNINEYTVHTVTYEYPIDEIVPIQDVENYNKIFKTRKFDIKKDLQLADIEGYVTFSILKEYDNNITNTSQCWPAHEVFVESKKEDSFRIRWIDNERFGKEESISNDVREFRKLSVYSKGFLLENDKNSKYDYRIRSDIFPAAIVKVNYQGGIENIAVSRFEDKDKNNILERIWEEICKIISSELVEIYKEKGYGQFWKIVTIYCLQYKIEVVELLPYIFNDVKFPFISSTGTIIFDYINNMDEIPMLPQSQRYIIEKVVGNPNFSYEIEEWNYDTCIIAKRKQNHFINSIDLKIPSYIYNTINLRYCLKKAKFINNSDLDYPDIQYILCKEDTDYILKRIIEMLECFGLNYERDNEKIGKLFEYLIESNTLVEFDNAYCDYLAYGLKNFNITHPITKLLIQCKWMLSDLKDSKDIDKMEWAIKNDLFQDNYIINQFFDEEKHKKYDFNVISANIEDVCRWLNKYYNEFTLISFSISGKDFIPNSIEIIDEKCFVRKKEVEYNNQFFED